MDERQWYYAEGQERRGPVGEDQMRAMAESGLVRPETLVWTAGMENWQKATETLPSGVRPAHWGGEAPPPVSAPPPPATSADASASGPQTARGPWQETQQEGMAGDPDAPDPDTFMGAVKTCFSKYATFEGRARRPEFWWFALFTLAGSMVASFLDMALFGAGSEAGLLGAVFSLAVLIPSIAVGVRRLHDTDRVGWWYLLVFIPLIGFIVLLIFFVQRGTEGPNRFGPEPR
ncbi:DUF805 domain-containing protein [Zhengella sp. ZM62]|uniref:DUF805 domain-containing protein n=1 Tax=Zhengella sedimenti TaxID=3390035 RepID=UPI003976F6CF